jgi:GDPmannose 4,6-dehydratase
VESLLGDPTKAREKLGWTPEISFPEMITEMVAYDVREASRESICLHSGFPLPGSCEAFM